MAGTVVAVSALEDTLDVQLRAAGLAPYERQFLFAKQAMGRRWAADFCWPDHHLIVEVDGGVYSGGRHTRGKGFEGDCDKLNAAAKLGYAVLRFTAKHIKDGSAVTLIEEMVRERT